MSEPTLTTLTRRLEHLEQENRRLKILGLVGLLGLVALALMGQALPKERIVQAQAVEIRDRQGAVQAVLSGSTLRFYDLHRRPVLTFGVGEYGPAVSLSDENGQVRLHVGVMPPEITPSYSPEQRSGASLVMFDRAGKVVWSAP